MHRRTWQSLFVAGGLWLGSAAFGQETPAAPPKPEAAKPAAGQEGEMNAEMKAAMQAMMPGPAHAKLAKLAGDWTVASKLIMGEAPPEETTGTSKFVVVMEGRYLHEESAGTMMGMPFKSAKLIGYNNGSKKYEAVWTYTMGTGMMLLNGVSTDEGKTIKFDATWDNEIGVRENMTITYTFADDDHFTVKMAAGKMPDGTDGPVMEIAYTRKK